MNGKCSNEMARLNDANRTGKNSGIGDYPSFDGLTYNMHGYFAHCLYFQVAH